MNVWSHLLAAPIHLYATWRCFDSWDPQDCTTWGLLVLGLALATYSVLSAGAHLLSARSSMAHLVLFAVDYVGIAVYGYGAFSVCRAGSNKDNIEREKSRASTVGY